VSLTTMADLGKQSLTSVDLSYMSSLTAEATLGLARACGLKSLFLNGCTFVNDDFLEGLASALPGLKGLEADECIDVGNRGVRALALACPGLQRLAVQHSRCDDDALSLLAERCGSALRLLRISFCRRLTVQGLESLVTHAHGLQEISAGGCGMPNHIVARLCDACCDLRRLDVHWSRDLTDVHPLAWCAKLTSLNLSWCQVVDPDQLVAVLGRCVSLERLCLDGARFVDLSLVQVSTPPHLSPHSLSPTPQLA
jgi:hypothetical protein